MIRREGKKLIRVGNGGYVEVGVMKSVIEDVEGIGKWEWRRVWGRGVKWVVEGVLWKK